MTHYKTLGVSKDATEEQIKKAFKKLALKHHPDRGGDSEKFKEIQKAYETLTKEREEYDESLNPSFGSFMDRLFTPRRRTQKTSDVRFELRISLEDAFMGNTKKLKITRKILCESCDATGTKDGSQLKCIQCHGTGRVKYIRQMGMMQILQEHGCPACDERGYVIADHNMCQTCSGSAVVDKEQLLEVKIPKGSSTREAVLFSHMADEKPEHITGDLIVVFIVKTHPIFTRDKNDLRYRKELSLYEALKGYSFNIQQLDGSVITIKHNGLTQPNTTSTIANKGMTIKNSTERGKLHITFQVKLPELPDSILEQLRD